MKTQHLPQQDTNANTSFNYYADDRLHVKTDGRGATTTMSYDNRGLVTGINYALPGATQPPQRANAALAVNGGKATASSQNSNLFSPSGAVNGDRKGINWGTGGGWGDGTAGTYPDWLQVEFSESRPIDEINVVTLQDTYASPVEPDETTTFNTYGSTDYQVQYWNGSDWADIPNGNVTANNKVWRKFTFSSITTSKIRVLVNNSLANYSRIVELEAWGPDSPSSIDSETSFTYDALGNRISMTDASGSIAYEYNELSQMTAETRAFIYSLPNAPLANNSFKLEYSYNLSGGLKSLKDPYGEQINYGYDEAGRLKSITGSTFGGVTDYGTNAQYRAWGGLREVNYASGMHLALTYNNRLQASGFNLQGATQNAIINKTYNYYSDGKIKYVQDSTNPTFDRLNTYDNIGRVMEGKSGAEARGQIVPEIDQQLNLPYRQSYAYDAFGNMTGSTNLHWGETSWEGQSFDQTYEYSNKRVVQTGWTYDADGRNTRSSTDARSINRTFSAAGKIIRTSPDNAESKLYYDGNGNEIKRQTATLDEETGGWGPQPTKYYIRSSVLKGRVISEAWASGKKHRSYVKGIGNQTAVQTAYASETAQLNELVLFEYSDSSGMSYRTTNKLGEAAATGDGGEGSPIETDPLGGSVGVSTPYFEPIIYQPDPEFPDLQPFNTNEGPQMQNFGSLYATFGSRIADLPGFGTNWGSFGELGMVQYEERVWHATRGLGFVTDEEYAHRAYAEAAAQAAAAGHEGWHTGTGDGTGGDGGQGDQTTWDVDLENNTVTIFGNGYWDFEESQTQSSGAARKGSGNLSDCLKNLLDEHFPAINVNGQRWRPAMDARFVAGFNDDSAAWIAKNLNPFIEVAAVTLGIKDIYYDSKYVSIAGETENSMKIIIEELYHVNQFLRNWAVLPTVKGNPTYEYAKSSWKAVYMIEAAKAMGYENYLEEQAKNKTDFIMENIEKAYKTKTPCKNRQ